MPGKEHSLATEARALDARARFHKREAQRHREAARACRERQAAVEAECRRLGIKVTYEGLSGEGDIHGRRDENIDPRS